MPQALIELGSVTEAIPYRWLFWPEVIRVFGVVIVDLEGIGEEAVEQRIRAARNSQRFRGSVERWNELIDSFNYFEIGALFSRWKGSQDSSEDVQLALASSLIEPWTAKIRASFPESRATVRIAQPEPDLGVCIEVTQGEGIPRSHVID